MKTCTKCGQVKELSEFSKNRHNKSGFNYRCKACERERIMQWKVENPDKQRDSRLRRNYGISLDAYDQLLQEQGGVCAICGTDNPGSNTRFMVDHNHDTGEVRGLLCGNCNRGIGLLGDNISTLSKAITYLSDNGSYG